MNLEDRVMQEMKLALKEKDQAKLRTLRAIKSAIQIAKTEKDADGVLTEEQENKILQKMAKQRADSITIYEEQGREDLAQIEREELEVINSFLPEQMSEEEIANQVQKIIEQVGASGMQDMGKVMGVASKEFAGKADMSIVSKYVKEALN